MKHKMFSKCLLLSLILVLFGTTTGCDNEYGYSSNYIHTSSFFHTVRLNDWSTVETGHWYTRIRVPAITYSVIDYGSVLVYYRNSDNNWILLPYSTTFYDAEGYPFAEEIWFGFALGTIDIDYIYSNPLDPTPRELYLKIIVSDYYG